MSTNHVDFGDSLQSCAALEPNLDGLRVLVIEDHALTRLAMECLLTPWGCRVTLADGTLTACDHVRHDGAPDIILSDYRLNDGYDGFNAIRLVRELSGRQIPACLISADADGNLWQQAEAMGVCFLRKPASPNRLRSVLLGLPPSNGLGGLRR